MKHSEIIRDLHIDYSDHDSDQEGEVEFRVQYCLDYVRVRFRGTEGSKLISGLGIIDVFRDLRFWPWRDDRIHGWVHAGILKGARMVVDRRLVKELSRDLPIRFEGHSMGGGLAQVAHALMLAEGFPVAGSVVFGCPRIFSQPPALPGAIHYRNGSDLVPQLPLRLPFINYAQAGEFRQLGRPGRLWSVKDHGCEAYRRELRDIGW
jgi:hypothetical protein